jgi:hypothetical protein
MRRIKLFQILQGIKSICKTRNHTSLSLRYPSVHRVREKSIIETYAPYLCNILARVLQEECLEDSQPYAHPCKDAPVALRRLPVLTLL